MKYLVYFFLFGMMLFISGCSLFDEGECDKTKKPEINFDFEILGQVMNYQDNDQKDLTIQIDFYKEHCGGSLSQTFTFGSQPDNFGIMEGFGLGITVGFKMNNEKDKLHLTFKYKEKEEDAYQVFGRKTIPYSMLANCPENPARSIAFFKFEVWPANPDASSLDFNKGVDISFWLAKCIAK